MSILDLIWSFWFKIEAAQILGAVGVLIYLDPRDYGTVTEDNGYAPYVSVNLL